MQDTVRAEGRAMGMLWEGYQQISNRNMDYAQDMRTQTIEDRLAYIEQAIIAQAEFLGGLVKHLELRFGEDLDGDQRIG
jgi:hypothetical protein